MIKSIAFNTNKHVFTDNCVTNLL